MSHGNICPGPTSKNLTFLINSDILGINQQTFSVKIVPVIKNFTVYNFAGRVGEVFKRFRPTNFTQPGLTIKSIDETGLVVIVFSESFFVPKNISRLQTEEYIDGVKR